MRGLIITGFARSGSSVLAKFLNMLGYDTGGSWNSEINAGFEDDLTQKIVTTYMMNAHTEDLILFIEKEIQKVDKIVVKHPRFLYNPEIVRIWTTIFPKTSLLVTYRNPFHSLESKKRQGNFGYYSNLSPSELDQKFHNFISLLIHLRIRHHILYFPDFLTSYDEVCNAIFSLGIFFDKDKGRTIWDNLVDPNLVHFK